MGGSARSEDDFALLQHGERSLQSGTSGNPAAYTTAAYTTMESGGNPLFNETTGVEQPEGVKGHCPHRCTYYPFSCGALGAPGVCNECTGCEGKWCSVVSGTH